MVFVGKRIIENVWADLPHSFNVHNSVNKVFKQKKNEKVSWKIRKFVNI